MKRRKNDPRVVEILAAFDRVATSSTREGSCLCHFMMSVADTGCDRFVAPGGWADDAIRAVLLAFVIHAPDDDLDQMLEAARKEHAWLANYEIERASEDAARTAEAN